MLGLGTSLAGNTIADVAYGNIVPPPPPPPDVPPFPPIPPPLNLDGGGLQPSVHRTLQGPTLSAELTSEQLNFNLVMDAGGVPFIPGPYGSILISTWTKVLGWSIVGSTPGSLVIDVWRLPLSAHLAGVLPTAANSICGGNYPTVLLDSAGASSILPGWDINLNQNDVLTFNIRSCVALLAANLTLYTERRKLQ